MAQAPPETFLDAVRSEGNRTRLLPPGVVFQEDVPYGSGGGRPLTLDLFDRAERPPAPRPAIVFIHGGGWQNGDPKQFYAQAAYLAWKHGFFAVSIRYRLSGEAAFPAALHDAKCAVRWVRAQAEAKNISPERIAASGGSAGGHLAAMLGVTRGIEALEGDGGQEEFSSHVNAIIPFNGVMDLEGRARELGEREAVVRFLGGKFAEIPARYRDASPLHHAGPGSAPALLLHGESDETVPHEQSLAMCEKLREAGVPCEVEIYPGQGHGWFNGPPHCWPTLQRMEAFLVQRFEL